MNKTDPELLKQREIRFCPLHPDPDQARSALRLLDGVAGILEVRQPTRHCVVVRYDLRRMTLQLIEAALIELGFHLDGSLLMRLKRALCYYTEETQRANLNLHHADLYDVQEVFVNRYTHKPHGCRDDRPQHWREYL
ncbi:MAG: hypothetical protein R3310_11760 [Candidatus Competibacteraceae bacterium]|nr:hypothetical protein [Candidatus Competibacteraceae bacterium]